MRISNNEPKLDFKDVVIVPKLSCAEAHDNFSAHVKFKLKHTGKIITTLPFIVSNRQIRRSLNIAKVASGVGILTELSEIIFRQCENGTKDYFYHMGCMDIEKFKSFIKMNTLEKICIDNDGYYTDLITTVSRIRELYPELMIMVGSVVDPEQTEQLILAGADCVKVGIGGNKDGYIRAIAGVGYPQLSAIIECAEAAHSVGGLICSDGGCNSTSDIIKAFVGGADFVTIDDIIAGTYECSGDKLIIHKDGSEFPVTDIHANMGGIPTHVRCFNLDCDIDGTGKLIDYRGRFNDVITEISYAIEATLSYTGCNEISELTKRARFVKVNS